MRESILVLTIRDSSCNMCTDTLMEGKNK